MDLYITGTIKEVFYKTDSGFMVGIIKVKTVSHNEIDKYINKTITFSGNFHEIIENSEYKLFGEFVIHPKYGNQFKVIYYEKMIPEEKNAIISFLSSGIFPGVGVKTATKIVDRFGDDTLNLILEDYNNLLLIPSIKEEKAKKIYDILYKEQVSYKTIVYLQEKGFSINDSIKIYEVYRDKTINIIDNNIYDIIDNVRGLGFTTVDSIAIKNGTKEDDDIRILSCILYSMKEICLETGNTYSSLDEIYLKTYKNLNINITKEQFNMNIMKLNSKNEVIILEDKYILKNVYDVEKNIASRVISIMGEKYKIGNASNSIKFLEDLFKIKYNDLQKGAIIMGLSNKFSIITGGPGTGKTTIIKGIVELYKNLYSLSNTGLLNNMILLAPTGRAARRIMESTGFKALTIHKFLKWDKESDTFEINSTNKSDVKFVIIDESSMIDIFLFNSLLDGLKDDVRIIMVGDSNQLPSVLPGSVLKDLIDSNKIPIVELNELYRQKEDSYIVNFAYEIKNGNLSDNFTEKRSDYNFIETSKQTIESVICELCKKTIEKGYSYTNVQVLAPMYKGINGIDNLNNKLQNVFNPQNGKKDEYIYNDIIFREGDKVLQTKNINELEISNGDIGIIDSITKTNNNVLAVINFDGEIVEFNKKNFEDLKLAYAISIHKSQGSEFDIVFMPMDTSYERMLYKKLLYTGVTRAKKSLTLIGEKSAFIKGVYKNVEETRNTLLKQLLLDKI